MMLHHLDLLVVILFFASMILVSVFAYFRTKNADDYFVAGGELPWWLAGISHHVSGHSGAVFVAYAAVAYTHGFTMYVWWAFPVGIVTVASAKLFPVYWVRLRKKFQIQSPLEYLSIRYNVLTQQLVAWIGVLLKVLDVGAKWAAIGILLKVVAGIPMTTGILISGATTLVSVTFGGLWGVILSDLIQFIVQIVGSIVMFVLVVNRLDGVGSITGIWKELPASHSQLVNDPYTTSFVMVIFFIFFLTYNGGLWSLATRYISSDSEKQASKAARLSGLLYLVWPLILFFPMWASPLILPGLSNPSESYGWLMLEILPRGMMGLVIASLFAATMGMTSADVNTIAAVISRDILPVVSNRFRVDTNSLRVARITTFMFALATTGIALNYERFGGVLGLILNWFGALVGPIALPLLLGLLPIFKKCGSVAAISSIIAGMITFVITKYLDINSLSVEVGSPVIVAGIVYISLGLATNVVPVKVTKLFAALKQPTDKIDA